MCKRLREWSVRPLQMVLSSRTINTKGNQMAAFAPAYLYICILKIILEWLNDRPSSKIETWWVDLVLISHWIFSLLVTSGMAALDRGVICVWPGSCLLPSCICKYSFSGSCWSSFTALLPSKGLTFTTCGLSLPVCLPLRRCPVICHFWRNHILTFLLKSGLLIIYCHWHLGFLHEKKLRRDRFTKVPLLFFSQDPH